MTLESYWKIKKKIQHRMQLLYKVELCDSKFLGKGVWRQKISHNASISNCYWQTV